jgi:hypothetical protein
MGPVLEALAPAARAVLVATGLLGLLPLHAAWTADPAAPTGQRYVLDGLCCTYAPNARSRAQAARRVASSPPRRCWWSRSPTPPSPRALWCRPGGRGGRRRLCPPGCCPAFATATPRGQLSSPGSDARGCCISPAMAWPTRGAARRRAGARRRRAAHPARPSRRPGRRSPGRTLGLRERPDRSPPARRGDWPPRWPAAGRRGRCGGLPLAGADEATMLLMTAFYRYWRRMRREPAEALRVAQRWCGTPATASCGGSPRPRCTAAPVRRPDRLGAFTYVGV